MTAIHYSELKNIAISPRMYQHALARPFAPTKAMRIGTIVHHLVLGPSNRKKLVRYEGGTRYGNKWEIFKELHQECEIVTASEWDAAVPMAKAVQDHEHAGPMLADAKKEVALTWSEAGFERETSGVDIVGDGWIADLKACRSASPKGFMRDASNMLYHAQMADYELACKYNGIDTSKGVFLIAVESNPPYPVTVFRLPRPVLDAGHRILASWLERLRRCQEDNHWPCYTQAVVDFELPTWMSDEDEESEEDDDAG